MSKLKYFFILTLFLSACYSSRTPRDREKTYTKPYHRADTELKMKMFLVHTDDNSSNLFYKLDNTQLLYKKVDTNNYFVARLRFHYTFYPSPGSNQILDSGTVILDDKSIQQPQARDLSGYLLLRTPNGQETYLQITCEDLFGKKTHTHYIPCDKTSPYSQQNFLIESNKQVTFTNKIEKGSSIQLSNSRVAFSRAKVDYFSVDYSLPPPPFSSKEPMLYPSVPDSTYFISSADNHSFAIKIAKQGIYYVRVDSANVGCTILGVEQNFPKVQSHTQMVAASRFIMNKEEYQKLLDASDKQAAIESFWMGISGSEDRAKELIKRYYNRVQDANTFFTSHIEGWKTDMGMIYIIFGTPGKTYKTSNMETWEYYIQNAPPLTFRFEKIANPFSNNCYKLQRNVNYRDPWTIAVSYWREGRVYLED